MHQVGLVILTPGLGSNPSLSIGFSIQDEARNAARSAPKGARYYADEPGVRWASGVIGGLGSAFVPRSYNSPDAQHVGI